MIRSCSSSLLGVYYTAGIRLSTRSTASDGRLPLSGRQPVGNWGRCTEREQATVSAQLPLSSRTLGGSMQFLVTL